MLFTSISFLFIFLPLAVIVNSVLPRGLKNYWLLLMSLIFYALGEPVFVLIMIGSILFNYCMALLVSTAKLHRWRKPVLVLTVVGNIGVLFIFKYLNFTTSVLRSLPFVGDSIPQTSLVLPIGISFFTFQAMSYVIDVYRGVDVQKNPLYVGLYISFFPQLIAGPIVRYTTVMEEICSRRVTLEDFTEGCLRFMLGVNKKMLLANVFSEIAEDTFALTDMSAGTAWVGAIAYTLQIFYDFSGYSDMAIGLGRMFGFHFLENFDYPYISASITEFWRRWHISLGSWFRDYVYFPLGGSRVSRGKLIRNLLIVWMLTGIWHGANWTFIAWGTMYGVLIIIEKLLKIPQRVEQNLKIRVPYQIFTMLTVILGWVFFNSSDIHSAFTYIGDMFGLNGNAAADNLCIYYLYEYRFYLIAGCLCATPIFKKLKEWFCSRGAAWEQAANWCSDIMQFVLFAVSVSCLVMNANNPFIYFNF